MMERVRRRISDRKVLRLIHAFLKAGIMVEGTVRHPVTGSPQGGIISPMLSNIYLTAIDERYGRWSIHPREPGKRALRLLDRKKGKPTFYLVRYADDFVVLVEGTREDAEAEKSALAEFLKTELRMELSMEKTKVTDIKEGFDFLGYRVAQTKALRTGHLVGNLFIPKGKLSDLRHKIKVMAKGMPTGRPLAHVIGRLNPILLGGGTIIGTPRRHVATSTASTNGSGGVLGVGLRRSTERRRGERCEVASPSTLVGSDGNGPMGPSGCVFFAKATPCDIHTTVSRTPRMERNPNAHSARKRWAFGARSAASTGVEAHCRVRTCSAMESRMQGNLHVRFGERDGETNLRKGK